MRVKFSTVRRPEATSSWVPTRTRTMLRMKASAVMRKERMPSSASHEAARTSRSKRTWSVWVGVKAVKSWVPRRDAAQEGDEVLHRSPPAGDFQLGAD